VNDVAVALPAGDVRIPVALEPADGAWAAIALAHGAGSTGDHPFLVGFAAALRDAGVTTLRFTFPYAAAGRRMPGPATHAIAAWSAVWRELSEACPGIPGVAAGKSYGGRMASMAAAAGEIDPDALVYLGYPLHAPGKPEKPRHAHLSAISAPQLFLSGTTDPFVDPHAQLEAAVATCPDAHLQWAPGGHSFEVAGRRRAAAEIGASLASDVAVWLRTRVQQ
jgi:predicted alpha/beta-hydrolase family hydrolase